MRTRTLFIFTNYYPYSTQECFLGDELEYICKKIDNVHIIPKYGMGTKKRDVPKNCTVHLPMNYYSSKIKYYIRGIFGIKTLPILIADFHKEKPYQSLKKFKNFVGAWLELNNLAHFNELQALLRTIKNEDVVYFYWGVGWNSISLLLNKRVKQVSRYHGDWDLWEESYDGYVPFRGQVLHNLKCAISISTRGVDFLCRKYHIQALLMPLGSHDCGECVQSEPNNMIHIVSCSTVYPLKRVQFIFECINSIKSRNIKWTHLGGGPDYGKLVQYVNAHISPNLNVELPGSVNHEEIFSYYKNNKIDCFINLSTNEGVPVSMMEAASFDIPILATNVGSSSDIVTPKVGMLLSSNPTITEVCDGIEYILANKFSPREFWEKNYNAAINYSKFADFLASI